MYNPNDRETLAYPHFVGCLFMFEHFHIKPNTRDIRRVSHRAKGVYDGWRYSVGTITERAAPFCVMQQRKTGDAGESSATSTAA